MPFDLTVHSEEIASSDSLKSHDNGLKCEEEAVEHGSFCGISDLTNVYLSTKDTVRTDYSLRAFPR